MSRIILCGNGCGHDHNSPNGPTGCCAEHGPYMYFCGDCGSRWQEAEASRVARERFLTEPVVRPQPTDYGSEL